MNPQRSFPPPYVGGYGALDLDGGKCYLTAVIFVYPLASFVAAYLLSRLLNWLALGPWRRSAGAHWTERARVLFPTRLSGLYNPWLFAVNAALPGFIRGEPMWHWLPAASAAWFGAALSGYFADRQIWPGTSFKDWAAHFTFNALFLQVLVLVVLIGALVMPRHFCWQSWAIAAVTSAILLMLFLGLSFKILQWTGVVQPSPAFLRDIASREAERAGARLRQVWVYHAPNAQAFAILPMKDMLFSQRALEVLSEAELASVCAHEAAHLAESNWTYAGRAAGLIAVIPGVFISPVFHQFGLIGGVGLLLLIIALAILPLRLARRMEQRADATAARQTPDSAVYARALEKFYEFDFIPATMSKRSARSHPDLYDRMIDAGVTPAYERPRPARFMFSWTSLVLMAAIVVLGTTIGILDAMRHPVDDAAARPSDSLKTVIFGE